MVTLQNLTELYPTMLDDNIVLPDGLSKDTLKSVIMMRLGLCWPVYDEPEVFSNMLYSWFMSHYWNIERLIKVTETSYSPLENYDRNEVFTDKNSGGTTTSDVNTNTRDQSDVNTNTANRSFKTDSETTGEGSSETDNDSENINSISAFNSPDFQNDNKSEGEGHQKTKTESSGNVDETKKETGTYTDSRKLTGTVTDSRTIKVTNDSGINRSGRAHGNIGVTTTQEMFKQELELLNGYNMYYTICNWIERDLFIQVY